MLRLQMCPGGHGPLWSHFHTVQGGLCSERTLLLLRWNFCSVKLEPLRGLFSGPCRLGLVTLPRSPVAPLLGILLHAVCSSFRKPPQVSPRTDCLGLHSRHCPPLGQGVGLPGPQGQTQVSFPWDPGAQGYGDARCRDGRKEEQPAAPPPPARQVRAPPLSLQLGLCVPASGERQSGGRPSSCGSRRK